MGLELRQEYVVLRVDGDVFEIFRRGAFSERIPLAWLAVQIQPSIGGKLILRMECSRDDGPLYEVLHKAKVGRGEAVDLVIGTEEEPFYRQFFTQVAQLCGRPVAP
jgi:hypothetical protein